MNDFTLRDLFIYHCSHMLCGTVYSTKFLNRCLGMTLPKQKLMTEHFLKHLEKNITLAKREGKYDVGIKSISGHSVVIKVSQLEKALIYVCNLPT